MFSISSKPLIRLPQQLNLLQYLQLFYRSTIIDCFLPQPFDCHLLSPNPLQLLHITIYVLLPFNFFPYVLCFQSITILYFLNRWFCRWIQGENPNLFFNFLNLWYWVEFLKFIPVALVNSCLFPNFLNEWNFLYWIKFFTVKGSDRSRKSNEFWLFRWKGLRVWLIK
jgi:hypothetical protein